MTDSRALIRTYRDSEWRSTRFEAIRGLSRYVDGRSFQFLVGLIETNQDLAEQALALQSLSQHRTRASVSFIKKFRLKSPDTLKAAVAYAVGQAQIYDLSNALLEDLAQARAKQDTLWMKNLVLSLGELKEFKSVLKLHDLISTRNPADPELLIAGFLSLARLERESEAMQTHSSRVSNEALLNQIFQSALSQIQIRSQFKLEDYLEKTFESPHPHPSLPLELKAFPEAEVELGLSFFPVESHWERYLFAFRGLSPALRASLLPEIFKAAPNPIAFMEIAGRMFAGLENPGFAKICEGLCGDRLEDLELRLKFCDVFAEEIDFPVQSRFFLKKSVSTDEQVRFLNLWQENALTKADAVVKKELSLFLDQPELSEDARARLIRAAAELGVEAHEINSNFAKWFALSSLRASLLVYAERFALGRSIDSVQALPKKEIDLLAVRILALLEALAEKNLLSNHRKWVVETFSELTSDLHPERIVGILRVLRFTPMTEFEKFAIAQAKRGTHSMPSGNLIELNAVIALKSYAGSREASEVLAEKLSSRGDSVRGRALDSLCAHTTLLAKRAVMEFLSQNLFDEEIVDKIYRSFDPENKGGDEFVQSLDKILKQNPDHPQWEKLLSLKERLSSSTPIIDRLGGLIELSPDVVLLDNRLKALIPKFDSLDATTKFALRAAEQPFIQTQTGQQSIDKAPTVLEYCKALDLILDKNLGQKLLFPKLDHALHDFQTLWHRVGFGEDYPNLEKVLGLLGLKGKISPELFPLHKAKMMCGTFFNGKILQDRFKIFDGLRAWSVILLIFSRKIVLSTGSVGPLLKIEGIADEQAVIIAKKLMSLQDLRNPAAHRQTYTDLAIVENVRTEAVSLINIILG